MLSLINVLSIFSLESCELHKIYFENGRKRRSRAVCTQPLSPFGMFLQLFGTSLQRFETLLQCFGTFLQRLNQAEKPSSSKCHYFYLKVYNASITIFLQRKLPPPRSPRPFQDTSLKQKERGVVSN